MYLNINDLSEKVPDYYDTMYLDGYSPEEIWAAHHKSSRKAFEEYLKKKEKKADGDADKEENVKIKSEIKVKK